MKKITFILVASVLILSLASCKNSLEIISGNYAPLKTQKALRYP